MKAFYTLLILLIPFVGYGQTVTATILNSDGPEEQLPPVFYEDFANGLVGNNDSSNPSWTTEGPDGAIWELDYDGSNGDFTADTTYLLESESADNGWMIFDADGSNAGLPTAAYSNRKGSLTSPYIDLSNDSNVTLAFEHAYRWCCSGSHELTVFINDGSGWSAANSFQVNDLGTVNVLSGTVNVEIIITEMAALNDSVQIRFDWANGAETASHYFWMIDDVKIIKTQPYSSNILTSYNRVPSTYFGGTSYSVMPFEQISQTAYFFGGILENVGYNTIDSIRIDASVESEGFNTESYGYTIESGSIDTIFVNDGFTPTDTGVYFGSITGKDDYNYISTDTLTQRFQVTEYVYARDNGDNTTNFGSFSINALGTRQYGNVFDIYSASLLHGITLRLDELTTPTATGKIIINEIDPITGEVSYLTETEVLDLGSLTEEWFDVVLDPPVLLDSGQVVLPTLYAEYNSTDTVYISTSGSNSINGESLVQDIDGVQDGVDPGAWLYTTFAPCLRLNFDPSIYIVEGCIDEMACNFNSNANTDDGSCLYPVNFEETYSACNEFNWNGELYTQSGEYTYVTSGSNGCDSITTLNLTIINSININLDITSCDEYSWQGEVYTESGTYTYETVNENGCDSIVNLNLSIVGGLESQTIIGQDEVEPFSSHIYALTLNENIYSWSVTNGNILSDNGNNIEVLWGEAGIGLIEVVETDENGCTITHSLQVNLGNNVENSWNCINDACVDPLDGTGEYGSLNDCEANCSVVIEDSWNCVNDACVDPMDGSGSYSSLNDCEANCTVVIEDSWNCVNEACVDPMDGTGVYDDINECEAVCNVVIAESWNCVNDACVDPLDGSGVYSSLNDCEQECQNVSSINENIIDVNIYPNPSSNIFNLEFNSNYETEITVTNILGEQVYFESTNSIGEFNTQIDLSDYSKGIYNLTIKTSDGLSNHKLILQ